MSREQVGLLRIEQSFYSQNICLFYFPPGEEEYELDIHKPAKNSGGVYPVVGQQVKVPGTKRVVDCLTLYLPFFDPNDADKTEAVLLEDGRGITIITTTVPTYMLAQRNIMHALEDEPCERSNLTHDTSATNIQKKKHLQTKKVTYFFPGKLTCLPFNDTTTNELTKTKRLLPVQLKEKDDAGNHLVSYVAYNFWKMEIVPETGEDQYTKFEEKAEAPDDLFQRIKRACGS